MQRGDWSLDRAPDYSIESGPRARIYKVIAEVRGGYGGTLVTAPPDEVIDKPAFLAHYLRAFAVPPDLTSKGLADYDYRFERILARISRANGMIEDPRLDWDIWRAYLEYENCLMGAGSYETSTAIHGLESAKDLLWLYLNYNFEMIRGDPKRLKSWVDWLTLDLHAGGGRPLRRWYLLLLASLTDEVTPRLAAEQETKETAKMKEFEKEHPGAMLAISKGDPWNPFLVVHPDHPEWDLGEDPAPNFRIAIQRLAGGHGLSFAVLGLDPDKMPRTRNWEINLTGRVTQLWLQHVLDQESWSTEHHGYRVHMYRPIGRRASYSSVYLPKEPVTDGVYFFTYRGCLYVWPKAQMDAGAIEMLLNAGLIDEKRRDDFTRRGFESLQVTLKGQ